MKNILRLLLYVVLTFSLIGCTNNQKVTADKPNDIVPEPYKLAIEQINKGDLEFALKYLDLTIKDYKDSKYVFNANLLKSLIYRSKILVQTTTYDLLDKGIQKQSVLNTVADINRIQKTYKIIDKEYKQFYPKYNESIQYVYDNYSFEKENDLYKLNLPEISYNNNLDFFSEVGSPIPKDSEINSFRENNLIYAFNEIKKEIFKNEKVSFANYFYNMATGIDNIKDIKLKKFFNKVINLTENDKYNELRLKAIENLENIKKSENKSKIKTK